MDRLVAGHLAVVVQLGGVVGHVLVDRPERADDFVEKESDIFYITTYACVDGRGS